MSLCLKPDCLHENPKNAELCQHCGASLRLYQQYRAMKIIGEGGFGRTFLAVDESQSEEPACVIKQFCPQTQGSENLEQASQLFAQEAQRLRELGKHPQIPELRAYLTEGNQQYVVQEYIDGQDLAQILETEGKFSEKQIQDVLEQLLPVLDDLHQRRVIHRDIKPANIIRRQDGTLILVDFGAAKHVPTTAFSVIGTTIGSAEYASPEQAMGKAKPNSDIYSLGVTCLHLLTQITPFELFDVTEMKWRWRDYIDAPIQKELGEILDKMTVQATKKRYKSASEVLRDLQPAKAPSSSPPSKPKSSSTATSSQKPPQPKQTSPSPSPSTAKSGSQVELRSAVGYDYTRLRDLLAKQKWQEADEETAKAMLKVAGRDILLDIEDIDNFPEQDLCTIDRLWIYFSNGCFGFSIQKQIYQDLGGTKDYDKKTWKHFGFVVGWRKSERWLDYKDLLKTEKFPNGCLPTIGARRSLFMWGDWGKSMATLLSKQQLKLPSLASSKLSSLSVVFQKSPSPSPSTAPSGSQVELRSAVGYDYTRLRDLLADGKLEEADEETAKAILKVAGMDSTSTRDNSLRVKDIDDFPCEDLRTIDSLWVHFSKGRFGFSIQKQIYQDLGGTKDYDKKVYKHLGFIVGWRKNDQWIDYEDLLKTKNYGCLPTIGARKRLFLWREWGKSMAALLSKQQLKLPSLASSKLSSLSVVFQKSPSPSLSTAPSGSQVELLEGYDYTRLRDLLAAGKWKEADRETAKAMRNCAKNATSFHIICNINLKKVPTQDLRKIDHLWVKYSNGHFGFSVQKEIYQRLVQPSEINKKRLQRFGNEIGWYENGKWKIYNQLNFSGDAPYGHLPAALWLPQEDWETIIYSNIASVFGMLFLFLLLPLGVISLIFGEIAMLGIAFIDFAIFMTFYQIYEHRVNSKGYHINKTNVLKNIRFLTSLQITSSQTLASASQTSLSSSTEKQEKETCNSDFQEETTTEDTQDEQDTSNYINDKEDSTEELESEEDRELYTADWLERNFDSFQEAKDYYNIKAIGWEALAYYLNEGK